MASVRAQPWSVLEADNLTGLAELTEANLLKAIEERYRAGLIYTAVGDILVAVNPFRSLPLYDEAWSNAYESPDVSALAPHIYRVATAAYNSLVQGKKNQVCVISGESGAGKTESAKFIMKQVYHRRRVKLSISTLTVQRGGRRGMRIAYTYTVLRMWCVHMCTMCVGVAGMQSAERGKLRVCGSTMHTHSFLLPMHQVMTMCRSAGLGQALQQKIIQVYLSVCNDTV